MMSDEFNSIKEGDEVFIANHYREQFANVTRVTPTTFTASGIVFYKRNGRQKAADTWHPNWAYHPTPELRAKVLRSERVQRLGNKQWDKVTDDQLAAICAILDQPSADAKTTEDRP